MARGCERVDYAAQVRRVTQLALMSRPSVDFSNYRRHVRTAKKNRAAVKPPGMPTDGVLLGSCRFLNQRRRSAWGDICLPRTGSLSCFAHFSIVPSKIVSFDTASCAQDNARVFTRRCKAVATSHKTGEMAFVRGAPCPPTRHIRRRWLPAGEE